MKTLLKVVLSMAVSCFPLPLSAHGIAYEIHRGEAIVIQVNYDDGQPMSYAEVLIHAPGGKEREYQNGRTDARGSFSFLPDRKGTWNIKVSDGMGHGFVTEIPVDEEMHTGGEIRGAVRPWQKALLGISLIWAIAATWLYAIRKKKIVC